MIRRSIVSLAAGVILCQFPCETRAEDLFPVAKGSSWEYNGAITGNVNGQKLNQTMSITGTVTSVKKAGSTTVAVVRMAANGRTTGEDTYRITPEAVLRVSTGAYGYERMTPPLPLLRFPVAVGKNWSWKGKKRNPDANEVAGSAVMKIASREQVNTPAGVFDAYRLDMTITLNDKSQKIVLPAHIWFSPGKGMVKMSTTIAGPGGQSLTITGALVQIQSPIGVYHDRQRKAILDGYSDWRAGACRRIRAEAQRGRVPGWPGQHLGVCR